MKNGQTYFQAINISDSLLSYKFVLHYVVNNGARDASS